MSKKITFEMLQACAEDFEDAMATKGESIVDLMMAQVGVKTAQDAYMYWIEECTRRSQRYADAHAEYMKDDPVNDDDWKLADKPVPAEVAAKKPDESN